MPDARHQRSPTQELIARVLRIVRASPQAAADVLELTFLASQIEAATTIDREYRDARRVISRLRHPLWELGPAERASLLRAAEAIREACDLSEADIPTSPIADLGERERIEHHLKATLGDELDAYQIARITGAVTAALQH